MRVLDLFSGIGGFSLGLERAGMKTVAFCEIEPYCRKVLNRRWPHVPIFEDIRTLTGELLEKERITQIDVMCGGFPCQDVSCAGTRTGIKGERSGLWSEYARLIGEVRPRFVIIENVTALRGNGMEVVAENLAALRYDAVWDCIPASAIGSRHRRDRLWIVAANADQTQSQGKGVSGGAETTYADARHSGKIISNAQCVRQQAERAHGESGDSETPVEGKTVDAFDGGVRQIKFFEPGVGGMANGVSSWLDEPVDLPRTTTDKTD